MNIVINNLVKKYNDFELDIKKLTIENGEIIKIYGNNGAGKTTLLQAILDLIELDKGTITIGGEINTEFGKWKYNTTSFLNESYLMDYLKVEEYLELVSSIYKKPFSANKTEGLTEGFLEYHQLRVKKIGNLSTGNKLKVGILSTLITDATLVILDEPVANLDPRSRKNFIDLIKRYHQEHDATVLISSHDIDITHRLDGRNIILENGQVIFNRSDKDSGKKEIELLLTESVPKA